MVSKGLEGLRRPYADRSARVLVLVALSAGVPLSARAGVFGVPTNLSIDGQRCTGSGAPVASCTSASVNPPGFFDIYSTASAAGTGDTVHQVKLFIEVTPAASGNTVLDVKVFDAGGDGALDTVSGATISTRYELFDPSKSLVNTLTLAGDSGTTDNRLARLSCNTTAGGAATFTAANAGTAFGSSTGACASLAAGLYELRISTTAGGNGSANVFGVDVRDGSGAHYNVFVGADSDATNGTIALNESALLLGPQGSAASSAPALFYPFVDRGCTVQPSNYDSDSSGTKNLVDVLGTSTSLAASGDAAASTPTVTFQNTAQANTQSVDYGLWRLTDDIVAGGTQALDWRFSDYLGSTSNGAGFPVDPLRPVRMYLPNGYAPAAGNPNGVAPVEPILATSAVVVSGANPPTVNALTRYLITSTVSNPTASALTNVQITVPIGAAMTYVGGSQASFVDGSTAACTDSSGATFRRCTFATLAAGSTASLNIEVTDTPAASGILALTGAPLTGQVFTVNRLRNLGGGVFDAQTTVANSFQVGDVVTISGPGDQRYNGTYVISALTSTTLFQFTGVLGAAGTDNTVRTNGAVAECRAAANAPVCATYTPASSSGTFARVEQAGPACQLTVNVPALGVIKTASPDPVSAGGTLTYSLVVTNSGAAAAASVTLTDPLPPGTTFQSIAAPGGWACTTPAVGGTGTVSCTTASLAAGASVNFSLAVLVDAALPAGTLTNTAYLSANPATPGNNLGTVTTSVVSEADLTASVDPQSLYYKSGTAVPIVYAIQARNDGPSAAPNATVSIALPATLLQFQAVVPPAGWSCSSVPAVGSYGGTVTCSTAAFAAGATATFSLAVNYDGTGTPGTTVRSVTTLSSTATDPIRANNAISASVTVTQPLACPPTPGKDGALTVTGTTGVNTYYPGTANAAAGATTITLGAATGATTPIVVGDLLLVMQMQDAAIDSTNTDSYGDGVAGGPARGTSSLNNVAGYEYVVAQSAVPLAGGTVTIQAMGSGNGLLRVYTNAAATATQGQRRFQVVRVPQYTNVTYAALGFGTLTAPPWNGSTGGVLVLDVRDTLTLASDTARTVSTLTRTGSVATATTSAAHGYASGDLVTISGSADAAYNGTFPITVTSTTVFTYTIYATAGNGTPAYPPSPATGTITSLRSAINVAGMGFHGGGGRQLAGDVGANTDYRTSAALNANGPKGEGSAGSPRYSYGAIGLAGLTSTGTTATATTSVAHGLVTGNTVTIAGAQQSAYNGSFVITFVSATQFTYTIPAAATSPASGLMTVTSVFNTGIEGYPNGSMARGGPGNAGGGSTDGNPAANDENSGGGGGGNGGEGGLGGNSWNSNLTLGGYGGELMIPAPDLMALGGGGGAGTRNNTGGTFSASSGGAGGGLVMIRAGSVAGTGRIVADGGQGVSPDNDGGGGGGAGGGVIVLAYSSGLAGVTVSARGGRGADAWTLVAPGGSPGERHGPGGGGAGGSVLLSSVPAAIDVSGGANGITTNVNDAFGATPGTLGRRATGITLDEIPGISSGAECQATSGPAIAADVLVIKSDSGTTYVGQTLTYTLLVRNVGPDTATSVTVTDTLPVANVTYVSSTTSQGTCSFASPTVTCSIGTLARSASATIRITTTAAAAGTPTNTASVTHPETDPNTLNNTSAVTTTILSGPADLAVTIAGSPDPVNAGSNATFSISLNNLGSSAAASTQISVPIPVNTNYQSFSAPAGWTCTPPAVGSGPPAAVSCSYTAGAFPVAGGAVFALVVQANSGTTAGTPLVGSVSATTTTPETTTTNNTAQDTITVGPATIILTRATIAALRVDRNGLVEFATATQSGTRGFNLYATNDPEARRGLVRLNEAEIRAPRPHSLVPTLYKVPTAPVRRRYVVVEEIDLKGRIQRMGPFAVGAPRLASALAALEHRLAAAGRGPALLAGGAGSAQSMPLAVPRRTTRASVARPRPSAPLTALKLLTRGAGRITVSRDALEAAGLPRSVPASQLVLRNLGQAVALGVDNAGSAGESLHFVAQALWTSYTGTNAYVLSWGGAALPAASARLTFAEAPPDPGFVRSRKSTVYVPNAPAGTDPWLWDFLVGDGSSWPYGDAADPQIGFFDVPGLIPSSDAVAVRVAFWAANDVHHQFTVTINGITVGEAEADGAGVVVVGGSLPGSALQAQGNELHVTYASQGPTLDDVGIAYLRHVDVAAGVDVSQASAELADVVPYDPVLRGLGPGADYLIVSHGLFLDEAQRLAALKRGEWRNPAVVDVERAYDHFSGGVVDASAVTALVRSAFRGGRLRDVVLVGGDSFDFDDLMGTGARAFVPSAIGWDDEFGRVPSENGYADVNGDGMPDVAIGRLPVATAEQASAMVTKIAHQAAVLRRSPLRHLFVSDDAPLFAAEARAAAGVIGGGPAAFVDFTHGAEAAHDALLSSLAQGVGITHYFGHGGPQAWSNEQLLDVGDAESLSGPGSVFLTWACEAQFYQYLWGPSVNQALVLNPSGGALASFGPAGITDVSAQAAFYTRLYRELKGSQVTLGEAIRRAKAKSVARDPRTLAVVSGFNLLGDPSLMLTPPVRSR
jgi:uncharacterized repeat protein (TIGR01451 family)